MSKSVDSRVVEMRFDNSQFESAVKTSLDTLSRLKSALNVNAIKDYFLNANNAAKGVDLSGIQTSLGSVSDRFTTMGIVGTRVLQNLTDMALRAGSSITRKLLKPLDMIKSGGMTRAMNMQQAEFQFKGLNMDADKTLAAINKSLQGTPYSLDQAAKVMASLGASGITDPKKIQHITSSIAGTAAMTNSSFADIGNIYTTVAANGRLMTEQLRQLSFRGMNVSAALGKQMGKSEQEIQEMVSKGKISFNDFSNAMEKAFGEHATKSTEMYTGALEDLKAALSRIGAKPATQYLNSMRDIFNSLVPVADRFNEAFDPMFKKFNAGMKVMSDGVAAFFKEIGSGGDVFEALDAMFGLWGRKANGTLKPVLADLWQIFSGLFSTVDIGKQAFVSFFKALSPIGDILGRIGLALLDILAKIGRYAEAFDNFAKKTNFFGDLTKGLKEILEHVAKAFDIFIDKVTGTGNAMDSADLAGKLEKTYNALKKYRPLYTIVKTVSDGIIACIDKLAEALNHLLDGIDFNGLISALSLSMIWQSFKSRNNILTIITELLTGAKNVFTDFKKSLKNGFIQNLNELRNVLLSYQGDLRANSLLKIAGAIFILAYSLKMLSEAASLNGGQQLAIAVSAIGGLMLGLVFAVKELTGMVGAVGKTVNKEGRGGLVGLIKMLLYGGISPGTLKLVSVATSMVAIAAAVGILSFAVVKLAKLNLKELAKGIGGVAVIIGGLLFLSSKANNTRGQSRAFKSFSKSLIVLGIGLNLMAAAVARLGRIDIKSLSKGIGGILVLTGGIVALSRGLNSSFKQTKAFSSFSKSIIALSIGLNLMGMAVTKLADMDISDMAQGIGGIIVLVGTLVALSRGLGNSFKQVKAFSSFSTSIIMMSIGLNLMASAVSKLGDMDIESLAKGIGGILTLIGALVVMSNLLSDSIKQSIAFSNFANSVTIMSFGLGAMASAIAKVGELDLPSLAKGLGGLALALGGIYLLATQVSNMSDLGKLAAFSGIMLILGAALNVFAIAISSVGKLGLGTVALGILGIASALIVFAQVTKIVGAAIKPILSGALAIGAMSLAITAFGLALSTLANGIKAMMPIFQGLWDIIKQVIQAIKEFVEYIANSDIFQAITEWLAPDLSKDPQFANNYRKLGEQAGENYAQGVKSKSGNAKQAGQALGNNSKPKVSLYGSGQASGQTFVRGIGSQNGNSKKAGQNLGANSKPGKISMFDIGSSNAGTYVSGVNSKKGKSKTSGEGLAKEAKKGAGSSKKDMYDTGSHTGSGFSKGLLSQKGAVVSAAKALADAVPAKIRKLLVVRSPSRVMMAIGDYATQGFIKGIGLRLNQVRYASEKMATIATTGPNKLTNVLANSLSNIEDYQPTIKPVVDLSNVNASASAMNSIFGQDISLSGTMDNVKAVGTITRGDIAAQEAAVESIADKMAKKMSDAFAAKVGDTNHTFNFNIPFDINGREVAKSIATYTQDELNKMESRSNRQLGIV